MVRIRTSSEGGGEGNKVALLPLMSLTGSDHNHHRGCQSELRAGKSVVADRRRRTQGRKRLGDKDTMVVMGSIMAAVMSLPYRCGT